MVRILAGNPRRLLASACGVLFGAGLAHAETPAAVRFHREIEPLLTTYCYDCHGDGEHKGKVSFDQFASDFDLLGRTQLWFAALKNVRAGLMPPPDSDADLDSRPSAAEIDRLARWIKYDAFGIDPKDPDPGRVTIRRLNRVEYHNTIRDLMGIDYDSEVEFPPDDTGHGFDNLGEVLTVSPLLLEKYLQAAEEVVDKAVPRVARIPGERMAGPRDFRGAKGGGGGGLDTHRDGSLGHTFDIARGGTYRVVFDTTTRSSFNFDPGRGDLVVSVDGVERTKETIAWGSKGFHFESKESWAPGPHRIVFEMRSLPPSASSAAEAAAAPESGPSGPEPGIPSSLMRPPAAKGTFAGVRIAGVRVQGPLEEKDWVATPGYARFFPRGIPSASRRRDAEARQILREFATRAFRRPVEEAKVAQLVGIARSVYTAPGKRFEDGVARAMMAVLASPRFIFRLEEPAPAEIGRRFAQVDEWALASRLSYFLWSSMPDAGLVAAASQGQLRRTQPAQVERMLKDPKAGEFVRNFVGQWLQARDIETVPINARAALGLQGRPRLRVDFDGDLRKAMRKETEMFFDYVMREDRSVLEFIDSDYVFVNERLAAHYGIPGVKGETLRRVALPLGSPRGGVLTQGTVLAVTSNPTRTSPVKRGLFVLDNFLGTPAPPPPPNVPALEESEIAASGKKLTQRDALAAHRNHPLCASCHARMDPLGFAFENFNAMGNWRDLDAKQPIDASGKLITGETFSDVRELKRVLRTDRHLDFYRCLTEKMLTYALGRGLDYEDVQTVDQIVDRLESHQGRFSALLFGIVESAPFQKERNAP